MKPDFSRLTEKQMELLTYQGWQVGDSFPQPSPRTVKKLLERCLLIERESTYRGVSVKEYEVPLAVHMAWCAKCGLEGE